MTPAIRERLRAAARDGQRAGTEHGWTVPVGDPSIPPLILARATDVRRFRHLSPRLAATCAGTLRGLREGAQEYRPLRELRAAAAGTGHGARREPQGPR